MHEEEDYNPLRLQPTEDDEEYHICPYARQHTMPKARFHYHLARCAEKRSSRNLETCPHNSTHFVRSEYMEDHKRKCIDKRRRDEQTHAAAGSEWDDVDFLAAIQAPANERDLYSSDAPNVYPVFNTNSFDRTKQHTTCRGCNEGIDFSQKVCRCCFLEHPQVLTASTKNTAKPSRGLTDIKVELPDKKRNYSGSPQRKRPRPSLDLPDQQPAYSQRQGSLPSPTSESSYSSPHQTVMGDRLPPTSTASFLDELDLSRVPSVSSRAAPSFLSGFGAFADGREKGGGRMPAYSTGDNRYNPYPGNSHHYY